MKNYHKRIETEFEIIEESMCDGRFSKWTWNKLWLKKKNEEVGKTIKVLADKHKSFFTKSKEEK